MTSISQQPSNQPQALSSTNATQNASSAHNPSSSISGTSSSLAAAVPAASGRNYAHATKKQISPPIASGSTGQASAGGPALPQHAKSSSVSPVNGKNPIPPAVPAVATPTIVNSGNVVNGAGRGDHSRNPSVANSVIGQSGWMPNGGPAAGPPSRGNIQFGSINVGGPLAENHSVPPHQHTPSLSAALPNNPRVTSPQTSPSPILQPAASGGRPPSGLQGQGNTLSFGSLPGGAGESTVSSSVS
jgi:translation initiation factor 4G